MQYFLLKVVLFQVYLILWLTSIGITKPFFTKIANLLIFFYLKGKFFHNYFTIFTLFFIIC